MFHSISIPLQISKQSSGTNTYGWVRAQIVGALINCVFLIAICFSISIAALKRFINAPEVENPKMVLAVGGIGMFVNFIGLVLFYKHGKLVNAFKIHIFNNTVKLAVILYTLRSISQSTNTHSVHVGHVWYAIRTPSLGNSTETYLKFVDIRLIHLTEIVRNHPN